MSFQSPYTLTVENQMTLLGAFTHLQIPWLFSGPPPSHHYAKLSWKMYMAALENNN